MSLAHNDSIEHGPLHSTERPVVATRALSAGGEERPSRVRRRDAYLVALAAGVAAVGVCVASYMQEARQRTQTDVSTENRVSPP
jgi:ferric-dicitrate binding protein FerR (iron transport regulator)